LTYRFTEEISSYVKYSRGWKAGHFNANNDLANSAEPETLDAYEWGIVIAAFGERLKFNAQFFYYDYRDYQVFLLEDKPERFPSLEVRNADDAINFGAEAELILTPFIGYLPEVIEGLKIEVRPGWLETRFLDFTDTEERRTGSGTFLFKQYIAERSCLSGFGKRRVADRLAKIWNLHPALGLYMDRRCRLRSCQGRGLGRLPWEHKAPGVYDRSKGLRDAQRAAGLQPARRGRRRIYAGGLV
jgi:outer membrane receptor protein involved in Fe transport